MTFESEELENFTVFWSVNAVFHKIPPHVWNDMFFLSVITIMMANVEYKNTNEWQFYFFFLPHFYRMDWTLANRKPTNKLTELKPSPLIDPHPIYKIVVTKLY